MAARLVCAHLAGLMALASWFAVGSDSVADDFGFFFLISAAVSLPIFVCVLGAAVLFAPQVERNMAGFVLGGPVVICLGWAALAGADFVEGIALATGTASLIFGALWLLDWPRTPSGTR